MNSPLSILNSQLPKDGSVESAVFVLELIDGRCGYTREELATFCGCSIKNIEMAEKNALRKLRLAFTERLGPQGIIAMEQINELEAPIWAVVTHDQVLLTEVPYKQAADFVRITAPRLGHKANDITITTTDVVTRMRQKESTDA